MKKVFLFSECDYVAANTQDEAIELYKDEGGLEGTELEEAISGIEEIDTHTLEGTMITFPLEDEDSGELKVVEVSLLDLLKEADPEGTKFEGAFWLVSLEP